MTIKYIPEGDKFKANQLWGEARHQLSILKNAMSFQNLQQLQKTVRFNDGTIIKCISCFGQDVVKVFVPQQVGEVKYREDIRIRYLPAMEVYGSKFASSFRGIVLCKGGGFDPPYEFFSVPKDFLPDDKYWEEPEPLPKQRLLYNSEERKLEDVVPKGVAAIDLVDKTATTSIVSWSGGFIDILTSSVRNWWEQNPPHVDCWKYGAESSRHHSYTRTESLSVEHGLSYRLSGEADPGRWPSYVYEGVTYNGGNKPSHLMNFGGNLYRIVQGSGFNDFVHEIFLDVYQNAEKFVDGHWERDDENVNFDSIIALAEAQVFGIPWEFTFPRRWDFFKGNYSYSVSKGYFRPWHHYGSVMDENHYAFVYSLWHSPDLTYNRPVADIKECVEYAGHTEPADCGADYDIVTTKEETDGPLNVVVDGVIFEVFPTKVISADSPRLQSANLKYFRVGEKSIGLFWIEKNHWDPIDHMYVYASVASGGNRLVVTEMSDGSVAIPGVTDLEGNPVYAYGGLRLIKETITEEKEIVEG